MIGPILALFFLSLALAWTVFFRGGVWPHDWDITVLIVGITALFYWLFTPRIHRAPALPFWLRCAIFLLPVYLALQLIPLPLPVLQVLSPARAHLVQKLAPILPGTYWAPISVNTPAALLGLFSILCYTVVFLLVRDLAWSFSARPWIPVIPLLLIAAFEAALGMFQTFLGWPSAEALGTYTNRDHFSGFLEMTLPFAALYGLAILRRAKARFEAPATPAILSCILWAVGALILLAITYSLSRMGFLVALCVLFLVGVLSIGPRLPSRIWRWSSVAVVGGVIVLMLIFFPPGQLIERFADFSSTDKLSGDTRVALWKDTLPLISEFPVFGTGLGGFQSSFLKFQSAVADYRVEFAHNDYLQYIAEMGFAGFALLAAIFIGILTQLFRGILKLGDEDRRLLEIACTGAFAAILLHSLADFNMYVPANAMTLAWIGGIGTINGLG